MLAAFLTALLWSVAVVSATRGSRLIGSVPFNLVRLLLALALLAAWSHSLGGGLRGDWVSWFVLSGVIGFGFGDLAGYAALTRLGSRLSMLVVHCLSMPFGALLEWVWLGTGLTAVEVACCALILLGVAVATRLPDMANRSRKDLQWGVAFATVAALGQALGAVISRKAYEVSALDGVSVDAGTATYQRTIGGVVVLLLVALAQRRVEAKPQARDWKSVPPWIVIHALSGPVIGVACFQWALSTTPAGIVLPILATIPLLVMPLAYVMEGEKPTWRSVLGGVLAVSGAAALAIVR